MAIELRRAADAALVLDGPAGTGRRLATLAGAEVLRMSLVPGGELPAHRVPQRAFFLVLAGSGRLTVDGESLDLEVEDSALVPADAERSWQVLGSGPLELLVLRDV